MIKYYFSLKLLFDVHFWIGKSSSQDEYAVAAYKTVELDTFVSLISSYSMVKSPKQLQYNTVLGCIMVLIYLLVW